MAIASRLTDVVLEPASQAFVEATAKPPFLYELSPDEARKVLDDVQASPIEKPAVDERWITVPAEVGDVRVRMVRPAGAAGDALLTEVSFGPGPVPSDAIHLDGPAVGTLAAETRPGQVLLTHLQMGFDPDATIASVRARYDGPVRLVQPGDEVRLGA